MILLRYSPRQSAPRVSTEWKWGRSDFEWNCSTKEIIEKWEVSKENSLEASDVIFSEDRFEKMREKERQIILRDLHGSFDPF